MKASELLLGLEKDQEKALERFFKDWDEIVKTCEVTVVHEVIRVYIGHKCHCPIIAVYFHRYKSERGNDEAIRIGVDWLGLAAVTAGHLMTAADLDFSKNRTIKGYRQRLLKPYLTKLVNDQW